MNVCPECRVNTKEKHIIRLNYKIQNKGNVNLLKTEIHGENRQNLLDQYNDQKEQSCKEQNQLDEDLEK